jgi:hypothetical protein
MEFRFVIPAKAGIQQIDLPVEAGFRLSRNAGTIAAWRKTSPE